MIRSLAATGAVAFAAAAVSYAAFRATGGTSDALALAGVRDLPAGALATVDGETLDLAASARPDLLVFGYAGCADVCPLTLAALARAVPAAHLAPTPRIVLVDVEPAVDTPARLRAYAAAFPGVVAVRPDAARLRGLLNALGAAPPERRADAIRHDGRVFVVDRRGTLRGVTEASGDAAVDGARLRALLVD